MKKTVIIVGLVLLCVGCGSRLRGRMPTRTTTPSPWATSSPPVIPGVPVGSLKLEPQFVDIAIECGENKLGGYDIEVTYVGQVVGIFEILPPETREFAGPPKAMRNQFGRGYTQIIGLHQGETAPSGLVQIARVRFEPRNIGKSKIRVAIHSLYNPDIEKFDGKPVLSTEEVTVTR